MISTSVKRQTSSGGRVGRILNRTFIYGLLLLGATIFIIPFAFMVTSSLKPIYQIQTIPVQWWPNPVRWENYLEAFTVQPFARYFLNSTLVTSLCVIGSVFSCTLAGWGFSRPRYWGRDVLFFLVLSVMMIPGQVTMIPLYLLFGRLGWINTFLPLTVPAYFGQAFYIFIIRQFFLTLPRELNEAAIIDGCSEVKLFLYIGLPLVKPAVVTIIIFTFMYVWNDFFTPLIYLNSNKLFTVALGLTAYQEEGFVHWDHLMAASTAAIIPVLSIFFIFQRYFVHGFTLTGLKV